MEELKIFSNEEFGNVRSILINSEPWFVGKDIADALGYSETNAMVKRLDSEDFISDKLEGMNMKSTFINESGLYTAIIGSKLESAKKFKKWVTSEVLPSIRKHGVYMTPEVIEKTLKNPDFIIQLATQLKEEQATRKIAEEKVEEQLVILEAQKPFVTFAETCLKSNDNILVRQLSKIAQDEGLKIGEKKLYTKLRNWNLILKSSTEPSQKGMTSGYFYVKEEPVNTPYGVKLVRQTLVTPKGQIYIIEKMKKEAC